MYYVAIAVWILCRFISTRTTGFQCLNACNVCYEAVAPCMHGTSIVGMQYIQRVQ